MDGSPNPELVLPPKLGLPPRKRPLRVTPGQTIPGTSWRITRWLGEGSMGVVYEARHVEIDRLAAIKIVEAALGENATAVEAFRSEARVSASIGSPNIVDVFDFAVLADGRLMMAMEFVPGRSLAEILSEEGPLSPSRVIGLFRQVSKGLQAAHAAGLVHRDIKPENIMVGEIAGRRDTVKLVDFGIATILGQRSAICAGTPFYMPPEGMLGVAVDARYDIYSVGCVMYEMLTGMPPYMDDDLVRVLEMHSDHPIPELATSGRELPRKLAELIRRCLAKRPADRFESMVELEAALCEAQIDAKLHTTWDDLALPDCEPERRAKLVAGMPNLARRGLPRWWAPILLLAGVLVGCVVAWPLLSEPESAAVVADTSEVDGYLERVRQAAALAYFLYPPVDEPQADTAYKVLMELEQLDTDEAHEAAAVVRAELAETLVRLGNETWDKPGGEPFALDFYVQAIMFEPTAEPARTRAGMSAGERIALRRKAAAGDFSETELIAVEPLLAFAEPEPELRRNKLTAIRARHNHERRSSANDQLDRLLAPAPTEAPIVWIPPSGLLAAETGSASGAKSSERNADALVAKADAARKAVRLQEAANLYHRALRVEQHRVDALAGLGRVYFEQSKYAKAVDYYQMAVHRSPRNRELHLALGDAYFKTLDYDKALEQYHKAKSLGSGKATKRIARLERETAG